MFDLTDEELIDALDVCEHNPRTPGCTLEPYTADSWSAVCVVCRRRVRTMTPGID